MKYGFTLSFILVKRGKVDRTFFYCTEKSYTGSRTTSLQCFQYSISAVVKALYTIFILISCKNENSWTPSSRYFGECCGSKSDASACVTVWRLYKAQYSRNNHLLFVQR